MQGKLSNILEDSKHPGQELTKGMLREALGSRQNRIREGSAQDPLAYPGAPVKELGGNATKKNRSY